MKIEKEKTSKWRDGERKLVKVIFISTVSIMLVGFPFAQLCACEKSHSIVGSFFIDECYEAYEKNDVTRKNYCAFTGYEHSYERLIRKHFAPAELKRGEFNAINSETNH